MASHTYEDEKAFRALSWTWAKAADTKDWDLLSSKCTEKVQLLYKAIAPEIGDTTVDREDYIQNFMKAHLGDEKLHTQHLLGAVVFTSESPDKASGSWQATVRHLKDFPDGSVGEWSAGAYVNHYYERVDGQWKLAGFKPHTTLWETGKASDVFEHFR